MQRRVRGLLFGIGIGLAGVLFVASPFGLSFEERVGLAWLFHLRGPVEPPREAVIVAIDEQSAIELGLSSTPRDWPRSLHGLLIDALVERGADIIVFDLAFTREQPAGEDEAFAAAIARAGRVLLFEATERRITPLGNGATGELVVETFSQPRPVLGAAALGIAPLPLPNVPARISRFWAFLGQSADRATLPALALMAYGLHYDSGWPRLSPGWEDPLTPPDQSLPNTSRVTRIDLMARTLRRQVKTGIDLNGLPPATDEKARQLRRALIALYTTPDAHYLNFYGPPGTIRHVGYARLLACRGRTAPPCDIDLKGRVVFVGLSELTKPPDFARDAFATVFARPDGVYLSGVEIAATAFANLLNVSTLQPPQPQLAFPVVLLLGLAFGLAAALLPPQTALPSTLMLAFAYTLAAQLLFAHPGLWLPIATPMLAQLPLALIGGIGGQLLLARRQQLLLRRAMEAAEAASEAKTEALRMAGHDIRTPVQAMVGYLEQFHATRLDATQQALLARVLAVSDALLGVLNTVLDLAAIDAGKMRIVAEPVDLRRLAQAEIAMLQAQAEGKGLMLTMAIAPEVPATVQTDPLRLRQILTNLLANAIKFTDRGSVALNVGLTGSSVQEAGVSAHPVVPKVVFSVVDTGIGIATEALAELFQPFHRGSGEATQRPGSGLGLSISHRLAVLLGGEITVKSQPGVGSTFRLALPAILPTVATAVAAPWVAPATRSWGLADVATVAPPLQPGSAMGTTLIVEDDPTISGLLQQQMLQLGLQVHLAGDGEAGWQCLQEVTVDLLITDYRMPGIDGPTLIRRVRADARFSCLRIIALTADTTADVADTFIAAGADLVLRKPVTRAELADALRQLEARAPEDDRAALPPLPATAAITDHQVSLPATDRQDGGEHWPDFDPANVLDALGDDPERLKLVIEAFCRQTGTLIGSLVDAQAERDAGGIARLAHRIAGTSLSFGAIRLGETCRALERAARTEVWPSIDPMIDALPQAYAQAAASCRLAVANASGRCEISPQASSSL